MRYAKETIFYTFIGIFVATAAVTILGITGFIPIDRFYLNGLFASLLLELVGVVIALFKTTDFFNHSKTQNDRPSLSFEQARDLTELFLESTHKELRITLGEFLSDSLKTYIEARDKNATYNFVHDNTDQIIKRNRNLVVHYFLIDGINFRDFLDDKCPLDKGIIGQTKDKVINVLYSAVDKSVPIDFIPQSVLKITSDAYRADTEALRDEIRKLYSVE